MNAACICSWVLNAIHICIKPLEMIKIIPVALYQWQMSYAKYSKQWLVSLGPDWNLTPTGIILNYCCYMSYYTAAIGVYIPYSNLPIKQNLAVFFNTNASLVLAHRQVTHSKSIWCRCCKFVSLTWTNDIPDFVQGKQKYHRSTADIKEMSLVARDSSSLARDLIFNSVSGA